MAANDQAPSPNVTATTRAADVGAADVRRGARAASQAPVLTRNQAPSRAMAPSAGR
jgi:hypothetical protein